MTTMIHDKKLARAKVAEHFIYLHPDSHNREAQLIKRSEIVEERKFAIEAVTDAVVIEVLLILIRHPGSKAGEVICAIVFCFTSKPCIWFVRSI
ncbi:MAG: hypothetical protein GY850_12315 [bacterium]|nr:hypothetical protein [bacterium]